jgi:predicted DNA-binding protein
MPDLTEPQTINTDINLSVRIPGDLNEKAETAAKDAGLKKADVIRLAIDRGIDVLLAQLKSQPK